MIWYIALITFLLVVLIVNFEGLFLFVDRGSSFPMPMGLNDLFPWFLLFSATLDIVLIEGGVVVSEYESGSDILETQEIFDLGIPEILGIKVSKEKNCI